MSNTRGTHPLYRSSDRVGKFLERFLTCIVPVTTSLEYRGLLLQFKFELPLTNQQARQTILSRFGHVDC
jgi:hypothetical protein